MVNSFDTRDLAIIIVASGTGSRFGGSVPKQFCLLDGKPVLLRTYEIFASTFPGAQMLLMLSEEGVEYWRDICNQYKINFSICGIGGATRTETVKKAVSILSGAFPRFVMIHDGARPLVSKALLLNMWNALNLQGRIIAPGFAPTDSLENISADEVTPVNRGDYMTVQTPQCFDFDIFYRAYTSERIESEIFTDDVSAVHAITGEPIILVPGDRNNIKITYEADMAVASALLKHPYPYPLP